MEVKTHLVEAKHGDKNEADEDEVLFRQQLQKWHEKFEETEQVKARRDSEDQEEVRSGSSPVKSSWKTSNGTYLAQVLAQWR